MKFMKKSIVLICDDKYVMPTIVTIQSIKDACRSERGIQIFICTFGISDENRNKLCQMSDNLVTVSIRVVNINNYRKALSKIKQKSHVTPVSLLKFELPIIFDDINTILYLDSDIIVRKNILPIFDYDITNHYLAASPELWKYLNDQFAKGGTTISDYFYFNSGVLLLNLKKMREDDIPSMLWKKKTELMQEGKSRTMDQDALNCICADRSICLPIEWNFNTFFTKPNKIRINELNAILKTNYNNYDDLYDSIRVLHYVGKEDKPWAYTTANCLNYWDSSYVNAGFCIEDLSRTDFRRNFKWYIYLLREMIIRNGCLATLRYMLNKIRKYK